MTVYGINAVLEALKARRVTALRLAGRSERLDRILSLAAEQGIPVRTVNRTSLDRDARGGVHQGVIAELSAPGEYGLDDLLASAASLPLFVVLDGVEDPQNVGAIIRSADAAGVDGLVRQSRHAARLDSTAAKASSGAIASTQRWRRSSISRERWNS